MAKCMKCGGTKKMGYMDLGGNAVSYSNPYQGTEPTSGYGTSDANRCPPNCPKGNKPQRVTNNKRAVNKARRHIGDCRKNHLGEMECDQ